MTDMTARLTMTADASQVVGAARQAQTSLQGLVDKTTGVTTANRSARASAEVFQQGMAASRREVTQLRAAYDPLYAAQLRMQAGQRTVNAALELGEMSARDHAMMLNLLEQEYREVAMAQSVATTATGGTATVMRLLGVNAQQASQGLRMMPMQLNQMAQMGAVTGNWMQAVTIQLPDLLQGFGAARLVFLGTAAGLAGAFLPALIQSSGLLSGLQGDTRDAAERMDDFSAAVDRFNTAAEIGQRTVSDLREEYGEFAEEVQRTAQIVAMAAAQDAVRQFDGVAEAIRGQFEGIIGLYDDVQDRTAELGQRSIEFPDANLDDAFDGLAEMRAEARAAAAAIGLTNAEVRELSVAMDQLSGARTFSEQAQAATNLLDIIGGISERAGEIPPALLPAVAELEKIQREAAAASANARSLALSAGAISFAAAAASAAGMADQLERAVNAAINLSAQGLSDLERAQIGYEFRDDPVGRAAALAAAEFDAQTDLSDNPLVRDRTSERLEQERAAYIRNATAAEEYRQATIAARRAATEDGGGGGTDEVERTIRDIERRFGQLESTYDRDIERAQEWRNEALANLDAAGVGYAEYAAQVEAIYADMLAEAYDDDLERREDWRAGVERGLRRVQEEQLTFADAFENMTVDMLNASEDAWVNWVMGRENDFSGLIDSMLEDLARLAYQQAIRPATSGIFDFISEGIGGLFGSPSASVPTSHSGSVVGRSTTRSSFDGRLGSGEHLAVVQDGQSIFTPRQLEGASSIVQALARAADRPAGLAIDGPLVVVNNNSSAVVEEETTGDGRVEVNIFDQMEREMAGRMRRAGSPSNTALRAMGLRGNSRRGGQ